MINPCGFVDERITSLKSLKLDVPSMDNLISDIIPICAEVFGHKVTNCERDHLDEILLN